MFLRPVVALALLALPVVTAAVPSARAGAWTQDAGGWFLKLGLEQWETTGRYDRHGVLVDYLPPAEGYPRGDYRNQALRVYAEYGIADGWTATLGTAFEGVRSRGSGRILEHAGLSDVVVQVKRRLLSSPLVISALAEAKVPTGYDVSKAPALGTGRLDGGGRIAAARSLGALYVTTEAGYRARGGRSDELPFALEAGLTLFGSVLLRGELAGVAGLRPPTIDAAFDPERAESRYATASLGLVLLGEPLDLVFTAEQVLSGRNTLSGTRFGFAVWRRE